jgi:anion-transporting  ArsA/GET3 family ATPase
LLKDVAAFVAAQETMFGGFRERADATFRLLKNPETRFLVVAAPEPDALREASYFVERLSTDRMPLAGLIVNRVHRARAARLSAARSLAAAEMLQNGHGGPADSPQASSYPLAEAALRLHAERMQLATRERRLAEHFAAAHPSVPVAEIPARPEDVHDLDGLREIGMSLAGEDPAA